MSKKKSNSEPREFAIPKGVSAMTNIVDRYAPFFKTLGNIESRLLKRRIEEVSSSISPIYINGLPRSGTTITLTMFSEHPDVVTHLYRDTVLPFLPYVWDKIMTHAPLPPDKPMQRIHKDGITVTRDSPEAIEEALWTKFFPSLHDPSHINTLDGSIYHPEFEHFYRDHIAKLAISRGRSRYVAKNNYNTVRMEYLIRFIPEARFFLFIRDPVSHIASMIKQNRNIRTVQEANRKLTRLWNIIGHYEFGVLRRPLNVGDEAAVKKIEELWERGEEVEGWARYWSMIYDYAFTRVNANPALKEACSIVRFEDLYSKPDETIRRLFHHARLEGEAADEIHDKYMKRFRKPRYYKPDYSKEDVALIRRITAETAQKYGYDETGDVP